MNRTIVILGITPLSIEIKQWAEDAGYTVEAFIEPITSLTQLDNIPVYRDFDQTSSKLFVTSERRIEFKQIQSNMAKASGLFPASPIVHPTATVSNEVTLENDTVICPNAVISPYAVISEGTVVMPNTYIPVEYTTLKFSVK